MNMIQVVGYPVGESWGMVNTFLLGLVNAIYMHDLKSLVYNHKEQVTYY